MYLAIYITPEEMLGFLKEVVKEEYTAKDAAAKDLVDLISKRQPEAFINLYRCAPDGSPCKELWERALHRALRAKAGTEDAYITKLRLLNVMEEEGDTPALSIVPFIHYVNDIEA